MPQLTLEEIASSLGHLAGWSYDTNTLTKEWVFQDFREAMAFINTVAEMAEAANHHPDIANTYNRVRLRLSTHSEGGVTEKDVALARKIEDSGIGARERRSVERRVEDRRAADRRQEERRQGSRRK